MITYTSDTILKESYYINDSKFKTTKQWIIRFQKINYL